MRVAGAIIVAALFAFAFSEEDEIFESSASDAYKAVVEVRSSSSSSNFS